MHSSRLSHQSKMRWLLLAVFSVMVCPAALASSIVKPVDEPKIIAEVLAVIYQPKDRPDPDSPEVLMEQAEAPHIVITRSPSGGCAPVEVVRKGVQLCAGDHVKMSSEWRLRVAFGDPKKKNEVTLSEEVTINSIDCGRFCHWFASFADHFTNRTQNVSLTNSGTVYEAISQEDDSLLLIVYDGEVDVTKNDSPPTPGSASTDSTGPAPAGATTTGPAAVEKVPTLYMAIFNADGSILSKNKMPPETLCSYLEWSTQAEVAAHRRPPEAGGNVAKFVNFANMAVRSLAFKEARCNSFLHRNDPEKVKDLAQDFERLGKVYNDWGDALHAFDLFEKALSLYSSDPAWRPTDELSINWAIAFRQTGQYDNARLYDQAMQVLQAVIAKPDSNFVGDALNVRGSIYYDQARKALIADLSDDATSRARQLLDQANADYQLALQKRSTQQQYILVNSAQVLKTKGDIFQREKDYPHAEESYFSAIQALKDSYGKKDNPQNKVAGLLVARAKAALANTYYAEHKTAESNSFYDKARQTYEQVIADAEKDNQKFADAYCGLASLQQILGNSDAADNYQKCLTFNTSALVTDVLVPRVVGLTRAAAIQTLAEAGLQADIPLDADGEFVETEPAETGKSAKIGQKIRLNLKISFASRQ